jgi:hypothetical protein
MVTRTDILNSVITRKIQIKKLETQQRCSTGNRQSCRVYIFNTIFFAAAITQRRYYCSYYYPHLYQLSGETAAP